MDVQTLAALKAIQQRNQSTSVLVDIANWVRIIGLATLAVVLWLGPLGWLSAYLSVNSPDYGFLIAAIDNAHKHRPDDMRRFPQKGWQVAAALAGNAPGLSKSLFFGHPEIPDIILYVCTNRVDEWGPSWRHYKYSMADWCQNPQVFAQFLGNLRDNFATIKADADDTFVHSLACATWKTVQFSEANINQSEPMNFGGSCQRAMPQEESTCKTSSWVGAAVSAGFAGLMAIAFPGVGLLVGAGIAAASAVGTGAITAWQEGCFD